MGPGCPAGDSALDEHGRTRATPSMVTMPPLISVHHRVQPSPGRAGLVVLSCISALRTSRRSAVVWVALGPVPGGPRLCP